MEGKMVSLSGLKQGAVDKFNASVDFTKTKVKNGFNSRELRVMMIATAAILGLVGVIAGAVGGNNLMTAAGAGLALAALYIKTCTKRPEVK
jgi:hypothetical protein